MDVTNLRHFDRVHVGVRICPGAADHDNNINPLSIVMKEDGISLIQSDGLDQNRLLEHSFDYVFGPAVSTAQIYESMALPLVQNTLDGFNSTIFAYGQTRSGKTHSLMGNDDDPGLLNLSMAKIFSSLQSAIASHECLVRVSYLEVYNEEIRDLLQPCQGDFNYQIVEDPKRGPLVSNLHEEVITTDAELNTVLSIGQNRRLSEGSSMASAPTCSHAVFRVIIESGNVAKRQKLRSVELPPEGPQKMYNRSKMMHTLHPKPGSQSSDVTFTVFTVADLASSDHNTVDVTRAQNNKINEIGNSLFALRTLILTLADSTAKNTEKKIVSYHKTKLTWLMQESLGGNAQTRMLATISSASKNRYETQLTLRYSSQARNIVNSPSLTVINSNDSMLVTLNKEIYMLKKQLADEEKQSSVFIELTQANEAAAFEMEQVTAQADQMQALLQMTVSASNAAQKVGEYATSHKLQRNMKAVAVGRRRLESVMLENRQLITTSIAKKMTKQAKIALRPMEFSKDDKKIFRRNACGEFLIALTQQVAPTSLSNSCAKFSG